MSEESWVDLWQDIQKQCQVIIRNVDYTDSAINTSKIKYCLRSTTGIVQRSIITVSVPCSGVRFESFGVGTAYCVSRSKLCLEQSLYSWGMFFSQAVTVQWLMQASNVLLTVPSCKSSYANEQRLRVTHCASDARNSLLFTHITFDHHSLKGWTKQHNNALLVVWAIWV